MKKINSIFIALCFLSTTFLHSIQISNPLLKTTKDILSKDILSTTVTITLGEIISTYCSAFEYSRVITTTAQIATHIHYSGQKKQKKYSSNATQKIIDFVHAQAQERNMSNNISVYVNEEPIMPYGANSIKNRIYLTPEIAQNLEKLIEKKEINALLPEEEKQFAECIGSIHHELTHLINNDTLNHLIYDSIIGIIGSAIIFYGINTAMNNYIPSLHSNFALCNNLKILRGILRMKLTEYIRNFNIYGKYQELRADDGIPSKKELLEPMAILFQSTHDTLMENIDTIKSEPWKQIINKRQIIKDYFDTNTIGLLMIKLIPKQWFSNPLVTDLVFHLRSTHPSDLRRALRLKRRIATLEG